MKTFIMCAGEQHRFRNKNLKQMMDFNGEKNIERMIRLVRPPWYIVTHKEDYKYLGNNIKPENNITLCNSILSTKDLWDERTIILLGDVYYMEGTLDRIYNCKEDPMFFLDRGEIFALAFSGDLSRKLELGTKVQGFYRGKLWALYRIINGAPPNIHKLFKDFTTIISDGTTDYDTMTKYIHLKKRIESKTITHE